MYKLWRRQLNAPVTVEPTSKKKQTAFADLLSQIIRIVKRKQELYIQVLFSTTTRPFSSDHQNIMTPATQRKSELHIKIDNVLEEQQQTMNQIKEYENQTFFLSKTYLYTLYVRTMEVLQYAKQKILMRLSSQEVVQLPSWEKYYEDHKESLKNCYQNLIHMQNYHLGQFLALAVRKQNSRIYALVPPKNKKPQLTLKPIIRLSSTELKPRGGSLALIQKNKKDISDLVEKKLSKKGKKLQTEKRLEQRQNRKMKKPILTFKSLYGILNVKQQRVEGGFAFAKGLEIDAFERNNEITQSRKEYTKAYDERKQRKNSRNKK